MKLKRFIVFFTALAMLASHVSADPDLVLPATNVSMSITYQDMSSSWDSYWKVKFSGIGPGYSVEDDKYYYGWCANATVGISDGSHTTHLYSCYDPALPVYAQSENWTKINYLVDKYRDGGFGCADKGEIQTAIWKYLGYADQTWGSPDAACVAAIQADVDANGGSFEPKSGDVVPVIADTEAGKKQLIFVEVQYFFAPEVMAAVMAAGMLAPAFGYLLVKKRR